MLLSNEATYRKLSTFQSVEELNGAIKAHRQAHKLSDTEREVLDVISRYSCKYAGVCYLSKTNIAKAVSRVRRTVIRVCQRLEALGIIKQYETKREGGDRRQSSNVIVIMPGENDVTPEMSHQEAPSKKLNNLINNNTYSTEPSLSFYGQFKAFINGTIGEGTGGANQPLISRLYGVYKAHSTPLLRGQAFDKESVEQAGWQALKTAVMATKSKDIRNLSGYYSGVLDRMLDRLYFESMDKLGV